MPRVIHFEIHAENPERAIGFYNDLFGWRFTRWGEQEYWLIETGAGSPGIDGGLVRRRGLVDGTAVIAYVCTVGVDSLADSLESAQTCGGSIALATSAVPGVGWLAYAKDTEGNIFGMIQRDPSAS